MSTQHGGMRRSTYASCQMDQSCLGSREIGKVEASTHFSGYGVSQDLTRSRAILAAIRKLVFWSSDVPNF
jgi:hypothetical protein